MGVHVFEDFHTPRIWSSFVAATLDALEETIKERKKLILAKEALTTLLEKTKNEPIVLEYIWPKVRNTDALTLVRLLKSMPFLLHGPGHLSETERRRVQQVLNVLLPKTKHSVGKETLAIKALAFLAEAHPDLKKYFMVLDPEDPQLEKKAAILLEKAWKGDKKAWEEFKALTDPRTEAIAKNIAEIAGKHRDADIIALIGSQHVVPEIFRKYVPDVHIHRLRENVRL